LKRQEKKAIVTVSDTGCGIPPEDLSKIFDKFYRSNHTHQDFESGCGLGLSVVHSIITLHGGEISVQSELGKGTTFKIQFPLL